MDDMPSVPSVPLSEQPEPVEAEPVKPPAVCPFCGGTDFEWGYLLDVGRAQSSQPGPIKFIENDFRWRDQIYSPRGRSVETRLCKKCGNMQLFADMKRHK